MDIRDADLTVRALNSLKRVGIRTIEEIQNLGRQNFLSSDHSYVVRLEVLNYLHKNRLYFFDDVNELH